MRGSFSRVTAIAAAVLAAEIVVAQDDPDATLTGGIASVRARPADPSASFALARQAAEAGDYVSAISALERILILNPQLDNIRLELGVLYLRLGSTELAEQYIRDALQSPEAPPEVRARAEELLASAIENNRRFRFVGSATAGLFYDTNANSGPRTGTSIGDIPVLSESTGQADFSGFVLLSGRLRYDLGFQEGHLLALDTSLFGRRYVDQSDLDLGSGVVQPGFDINLSRVMGRPADLLLRYSLSGLRRDQEAYLTESGLYASLRFALGPGGRAELTAESLDQDFRATATVPANNIRDGRRNALRFSYFQPISEVASVNVGLGYDTKSAEVGFEAYDEVSVTAGYQQAFDNLFDNGLPMIFGVTAGANFRDYDAPDTAIDLNSAQSDTVLSIRASLSLPLNAETSMTGEVGYRDQSSNYEIDEFSNAYVMFALTRDF